MSQSSVGELYRSLPLPSASKCIRVLDIDPGSTSTAPIVGNLRIVDLTTSSNFTALSYVWSSPEPDRTISCSGRDISVSASGHSALQHLWTSLGSFTIWIDAICIDQASTTEKEHQIPLMGYIYSQAATVYVWLGEGNESSDRAINYLTTAGFLDYYHTRASITKIGRVRPFLAACSAITAGYSLTRHPFPFKGGVSEHNSLLTLTRKGSPGTWHGPLGPMVVRLWNGNAEYATIEDIEQLLDRKWITRLWTYQEILLAVNPVVVCGDAHIHWDRFVMSLIFLDATIHDLALCIRPWKRVALSRQQHMAPRSVCLGPTRRFSLEGYAEFSIRVCNCHYFMLWATTTFFMVLSLVELFFALLVGISSLFPFKQEAAPSKPLAEDTVQLVLPKGSGFYALLLLMGAFVAFAKLYRLFKISVHMRSYYRAWQVTVDDLIDGIYTREATRPEDMAFGLWAILQRRTRLALPEVDYGRSKETIYIMFSRLLVQITGSPHLLLVAALNNMKEQPSWVPDWTSKGNRDCDWGDIEELIRMDESVDDLKREHSDTTFISMVDRLTVCVFGRRHGVVVATFVFRKTQSSYQQAEFRKHVYNLGLLMEICKAFHINWIWFEKMGLKAITRDQIHLWLRVLRKHCSLEPSTLLLLLCDTPCRGISTYSATVRSEILRILITMWNVLAQDRRILFQGSYPGTLTPPSIGWCRRSVKEGDLIIRCPGVQIPLIVRPCSEARNRVRIKSIANTPDLLNRNEVLDSMYAEPERTDYDTIELEEFHVC